MSIYIKTRNNISKLISMERDIYNTVNHQKTVCMLFGSKVMLSKQNVLSISLQDSPLKQVRQFKYLGLICDENLHWNIHIENMLLKIGKMEVFKKDVINSNSINS